FFWPLHGSMNHPSQVSWLRQPGYRLLGLTTSGRALGARAPAGKFCIMTGEEGHRQKTRGRGMAFTLRQLQYFIAVAEQGGVSRAAQALSISQSSVTEAVKELETDLGVALFERHSRGLTITHDGHQFLRHATNILTQVSDARRAFSDKKDETTGSLNLGVTSLVAGYVLSDLLRRYRRAYPGVDVTAIEDNGSYLEHLLIGGELDIAVMTISNLRDRMALQAEI